MVPLKVAVIGAGINGLACAVKIKEKHKNFQVVVISNQFSPNTTGDGAGGLWYPYLCGNTPKHLLKKWGRETYSLLHRLWLEGGYDVCLMPMYGMYRDRALCERQVDSIRDVFGFRTLREEEIKYLNELHSKDYVAGLSLTTFVYSPTPFLAKLHARFIKADGSIIQAEVSSLQDSLLQDFDVVINCTGLQARKLVPDDGVYPIRGQIMKVKAPWLQYTFMDEDSGHYIIPNAYNCVLGGTHQARNCNTALDDGDREFIVNGCAMLLPSLKNAEVATEWVGLRPGRDELRLEAETRDGKLVIHNYGHGGSGLTLFWGCAGEVLQLLDNHLNNRSQQLCKL